MLTGTLAMWPARLLQSSLLGKPEVGVRRLQSLLESNARFPVERPDQADIEQLLRSAVGLAAVLHDFGGGPHYLAHELGEVADGLVLAAADVDEGRAGVAQGVADFFLGHFHQVDAGIGHVVAVEELAARRAAAPYGHGRR